MLLGILTRAFGSRSWPAWARYSAAAAVVVGVLLLRLWAATYLQSYPILLFFAAIFACAILFRRGPGSFAVLLSAGCIVFFLLPPTYSLALERPQDILGITLFILIGLAITNTIGALQSALLRLTDLNRDMAAANARLTASEGEKDLLLREAGHRMKNDLTMLVALIQLQQRGARDPVVRAFLDTMIERMQVLARVHDRLQRADEVAVVDTGDFITALCDDLRDSLIGLRPIALSVTAEPHALPQAQAVAVGLIINELMTNALKYAFPDERTGQIAVVFQHEGHNLRLQVRDDGIGLIGQTRPHSQSGGLGRRLIRSMAAQLGGTLEEHEGTGPGMQTTIVFPAV